MTNNKIISISLTLTIIHFILTSVTAHYISVQIGTEMGKIVSDALNRNKTNEEPTRIYQDMENESDEISKSWRTPQILISLPALPFITPILKDIRKQEMNKVIVKEKTFEQFRTQGVMLDCAVNLLNSLSLGLVIYVGLRFLYRKQIAR